MARRELVRRVLEMRRRLEELLRRRPYVAEQKEKLEWVNALVEQIAWNIFDDKPVSYTHLTLPTKA